MEDMQELVAEMREQEREAALKQEEAIVSLRNELQAARDLVMPLVRPIKPKTTSKYLSRNQKLRNVE